MDIENGLLAQPQNKIGRNCSEQRGCEGFSAFNKWKQMLVTFVAVVSASKPPGTHVPCGHLREHKPLPMEL